MKFRTEGVHLCLQVLVQRLQKDILPKIESQIAELAKQDEPNEATKAISKQLKVTPPSPCCPGICWLTIASGDNLHEIGFGLVACCLHRQHITNCTQTSNVSVTLGTCHLCSQQCAGGSSPTSCKLLGDEPGGVPPTFCASCCVHTSGS